MPTVHTAKTAPASDLPDLSGLGQRRAWTLVVTSAGVALVVASMVALNTALGDIAVSHAVATDVDCGRLHPGAGLLAAASRGGR
jgi:hypothetical protein